MDLLWITLIKDFFKLISLLIFICTLSNNGLNIFVDRTVPLFDIINFHDLNRKQFSKSTREFIFNEF